MEKYFELLASIPLFEDIDIYNYETLLHCLSGKMVHYSKNQRIISEGEIITSFGIVLNGRVQVIQDDYYGNNNILAIINEGQLFGEAFACGSNVIFPFTVIATSDSDVLFIDCKKLSSPCEKACGFHSRIIQNLLSVVSNKNKSLTEKITYITKRTTSEKVLAYLSSQAIKSGSHKFNIPFNRQELADYLAVDRSALSVELSKLKKLGFIDYRKNEFMLLKDTES